MPIQFQHKGLDARLWAEVASTIIYLKNRSSTTFLSGSMPYEAWHGRLSDMAHLRALGCVAFMHTPKEKRKKLDSHSHKCIILGYTASNIFRLWDPVARKLFGARNIIFSKAASFKANRTMDNDDLVEISPLLLQLNVPRSCGSPTTDISVQDVPPVLQTDEHSVRNLPTAPASLDMTGEHDNTMSLHPPHPWASDTLEEEIGQLPETPVRQHFSDLPFNHCSEF